MEDSNDSILIRNKSSDLNYYLVNGNKRLRRNRPTSSHTATTTLFDSSSEMLTLCSCEQFLSVPLTLIFRYNTTQSMPLLTRVEAELLLQIGSLARELDILLSICRDVWGWSVSRREILTFCSSTLTYRALVPLLSLGVNSETTKDDGNDEAILSYVEVEWQRVILDLLQCTSSLQQCSEHNWTWSDSLLDAMSIESNNNHGNEDSKHKPTISSSAKALAHEKQLLSEVEEELIRRIQHIAVHGEEWTTYKSESKLSFHDLCFSTFCNRMFDISFENSKIATSTTVDLSPTMNHNNSSPDIIGNIGSDMHNDQSRSRDVMEEIIGNDKIKGSSNKPIPVEKIDEEGTQTFSDTTANTQNAIAILRNMNPKRSWNDI
jgi:hypothetical protein